jgi:hypothetical protein
MGRQRSGRLRIPLPDRRWARDRGPRSPSDVGAGQGCPLRSARRATGGLCDARGRFAESRASDHADVSEFRLCLLMQSSGSPFVISNAVRDTWLSTGTRPLNGPDRRIFAYSSGWMPNWVPVPERPVMLALPFRGRRRPGLQLVVEQWLFTLAVPSGARLAGWVSSAVTAAHLASAC